MGSGENNNISQDWGGIFQGRSLATATIKDRTVTYSDSSPELLP